MNPLVEGLLNQFAEDFDLIDEDQSKVFELFSAFCILGNEIDGQIHLSDLLLDDGAIGLDVVAVSINGRFVFDGDDVDEIARSSSHLECSITFIQSKRSESIDCLRVEQMSSVVGKFLSGTLQMSADQVAFAQRMQAVQRLFHSHAAKLKTRPKCRLYYVSTAPGHSRDDLNVKQSRDSSLAFLQRLDFIDDDVVYEIVAAPDLPQLWRRQSNQLEAQFELAKWTTLPAMPGVQQAYLGVIDAKSYLAMISDPDGDLHESLFYDNVRGFKGIDNPVNNSITETLSNPLESIMFPVLNNGITIVAREYTPMPGDEFQIRDFQIVNGCQTSHCLFAAKHLIQESSEPVFIPLRLVITSDEKIASKIILTTNSQTPVSPRELLALTAFQKDLEDYFKTSPFNVDLFYERRSGQYHNSAVKRARLVSPIDQARSFAAMFADLPHVATRYPERLLSDLGPDSRARIKVFDESHRFSPYVTSAYAQYKLENAFRTSLDTKYKPIRYHLLMAFRYLNTRGAPSLPNSGRIEIECEHLISILNSSAATKKFREAAEFVASVEGSIPSADRLKRDRFTAALRAKLARPNSRIQRPLMPIAAPTVRRRVKK
jgi:AIPR protein